MIGGLGRARQYDAAMDEVTDDSIARRPVVAVARAVIRTEIGGIERGLTTLDAETHDRLPRSLDSFISALLNRNRIPPWEGLSGPGCACGSVLKSPPLDLPVSRRALQENRNWRRP